MAKARGTSDTTGVASEEPAEADELDARVDYARIAERSEADRAAGRLIAHEEVEQQVEAWLRDSSARRRSA